MAHVANDDPTSPVQRERRTRILDAFRRAGARFVVTDVLPPDKGWRPLGKSGLFALSLARE